MTKAVYIHIPYCRRICTYCDFCKFIYNGGVSEYLEKLDKEIITRYKGEAVSSLYIGGGTPSCLTLEELKKLFKIVSKFNLMDGYEFTIEANPEDINMDKVLLFKESNVNRVSLGVQSFNKDILSTLGRGHDKSKVYSAVKLLKEVNINNINIDLMYAVEDDIDIVKEDLIDFINLDIPHISYYSLIIEDNTILSINGKESINEEIDYSMYSYIENFLENSGYNHYEISNYARDGYESIHNKTYWDNGWYYGFGCGSVSYIDNRRIINTKNLTKYLKNEFIYDIINEEEDTRIKSEIMLNLRTIKGLNLERFKEKYNRDFLEIYDISDLIKDELLIVSDNYLRINKRYLYVSNEIILRIYDHIKE